MIKLSFTTIQYHIDNKHLLTHGYFKNCALEWFIKFKVKYTKYTPSVIGGLLQHDYWSYTY